MSFSPFGKYAAVVNEIYAQVWDLNNHVVAKDFKNVQKNREDTYKKSYPVVFSPDGKYMAMEYYGSLKLYDVNTFKPMWSVYSWPEDEARIWMEPAEYNSVQQ
jgi:WD40 repeat protein